MLIKRADDQTAELSELERRASTADAANRKRLEADLRNRRAGIKGETESAYLIDFHFAESRNWAIVHDLRVEFGGQVAQVDHLLINRWMECYVLESKHFHAGIRITEDGEFERWNDFKKTFEGMASPLLQNDRHIDVLKKLADTIDLPTRMGLRIPLRFETLVLISPTARITRPKKFDTSRVIKADQLKQRIWKDIDADNGVFGMLKTAAKLVSSETVEKVARELVSRHRPLARTLPPTDDGRTAIPDAVVPISTKTPLASPSLDAGATNDGNPTAHALANPVAAADGTGPVCKKCHGVAGKVLHGQYGYYFRCAACEANTAIKFICQPGHTAKLRKQGEQFFRECAECGTSWLYFRNEPGAGA